MDASRTVESLAPEARFALRAVAAGLSVDDVASVLRLDAVTVAKHLRAAGRALGAPMPPPSEGDAALLAALASVLVTARVASCRAPSTPCPAPDVADALAAGELDGPLMLAEAEHIADCPPCLVRLVSGVRSPPSSAGTPPAHRGRAEERGDLTPRRSPWPLVLGVAVGLGAAAWYLLG